MATITPDTDGLNLPYSLEAEQSVLGAILMQPDTLNQVMDLLSANHFYLPEHQAIYRAMTNRSLTSQVIDIVTILEDLAGEDFFSASEGRSYLIRLAQLVPSIHNIRTYATIVKEKADVRQLVEVAQGIIKDAMNPSIKPAALLDSAEQKIYDIRQNRQNSGLRPIAEVINESYETFIKLADPNERANYVGIPSGIGALDTITTGLNRSDLIIVGARPGMGKTSFALNVARNVAMLQKKTVVFFNLEMSCEQMVNRLLSSEARVSGKKLRTGDILPDEWTCIAKAGNALCQAPMYLDDTASITVPEMMSKVRRIKDVGLVIIDYLQLMHHSEPSDNRVQEVSNITRSLKIMAKELNIPVLVCAQLARTTEKQSNHRPSLSDLRESGSIEQDADQVLFLYRDSYYKNEKDDPNSVNTSTSEVIVAKNRHGECDTVQLAWSGEFTQFTSLDLHHNG